MNPVVIIPARMASTRLPDKPLADICGLPMIVHVLHRAEESGIGDVYVACAEEQIKQAVIKAGGKAVLTKPEHPSGTDRIYEALGKIDPDGDYDIIVNVQGDLPAIDTRIIKDCLLPFSNDKVDITTLVANIETDEERANPNVVKAIIEWDAGKKTGIAKTFTRTLSQPNTECYHHIGIYAYRRDAIKKFTSLPPSASELRERLEQLRALDNGMVIGAVFADSIPFGVDAPDDLEKARVLIAGK